MNNLNVTRLNGNNLGLDKRVGPIKTYYCDIIFALKLAKYIFLDKAFGAKTSPMESKHYIGDSILPWPTLRSSDTIINAPSMCVSMSAAFGMLPTVEPTRKGRPLAT